MEFDVSNGDDGKAMSANSRYIDQTATIVAAYVSHNKIAVDQLPTLIARVHAALSNVAGGQPAESGTSEPLRPAVPVKRSVTADYIICLEDGKRFKSLKRHLRTQYKMSPEQYRARWGLSPDYPMVAPNYAKTRSQLAKKMGLGQGRSR
jgi:predicted transcriptional regulator